MPTLKELLSIPELIDARIIAGAAGLDAEVTGVNILEVSESLPTHWISRGELYLTSFNATKNSPAMQKLVIESLHLYGCSGIILCSVGQVLPEINQQLADLCDKLNFPCIMAAPSQSTSQLMTPLLQRVMCGNAGDKRSPSLKDYLFEIVVGENNPHKMLQTICIRTGCELSLFATDGTCVFSNKSEQEKQLEEDFLRSRTKTFPVGFAGMPLLPNRRKGPSPTGAFSTEFSERPRGWQCTLGGMEKFVYTLTRKNATIAYLVLNLTQTPHQFLDDKTLPANPADMFLSIAEEFVLPCAIALNQSLQNFGQQVAERGGFISDLLTWNFPSEEVAIARGEKHGLDISRVNTIMVININEMQKLGQTAYRNYVKYLHQWFEPEVTDIVQRFSPHAQVFFSSDTFILGLDASNEHPDTQQKLRNLGRKLLNLFEAGERNSVSIGYSDRFNEVREFPAGYSQATQAAMLGRELYGENSVCDFSDVFFLHHLRQMHKNAEALRRANNILSPLTVHDQRFGTPLIPTLETLFACQLDMKLTAERLFIHRNTLLYRRTKIQEVLGYNPFELPHLLHVAMALRVREG